LKNQDPTTGLVRTRSWLSASHQPYYDDHFFTFDQWIIVYGLANLASVSTEKRFLKGTQLLADFLIAKTSRSDGFFEPLYDLAQKKPVSMGDKWSRQAGSFHAKALMALAKLSKITGVSTYHAVAESLFRKVLSVQAPEGVFVTQENDQSTHLHPLLYTLEGLASYALSEKKEEIWPDIVLDRVYH